MAGVAYVICGESGGDPRRGPIGMVDRLASIAPLREPEQVRAWLISIAANEARQVIRGQRRRPVVDISNALEQDPVATRRTRSTSSICNGRSHTFDRTTAGCWPSATWRASIRPRSPATPACRRPGVRSRLARLIDRLRTDIDHA